MIRIRQARQSDFACIMALYHEASNAMAGMPHDCCWRRDVSQTLLRACLEDARRQGMRTARLDATANNAPAIALYQSEGFVQVSAGALDVNPDGDTPIPFVVMERLL